MLRTRDPGEYFEVSFEHYSLVMLITSLILSNYGTQTGSQCGAYSETGALPMLECNLGGSNLLL